MEFTREIYWNVGHGAWTLIPMYLLALAAFVILGKAFWQRIEVYKQGLQWRLLWAALRHELHYCTGDCCWP